MKIKTAKDFNNKGVHFSFIKSAEICCISMSCSLFQNCLSATLPLELTNKGVVELNGKLIKHCPFCGEKIINESDS